MQFLVMKVQSFSQIITINKPTPSFLQAGCPSCHPTNSVRVLKGLKHWREVLNNAKGQRNVIKPSKLLNDSKISISDCVVSFSWYLVAICTQACRFWRMFSDSIALMYSRESSTDSEPKLFTSHSEVNRWVWSMAHLMSYRSLSCSSPYTYTGTYVYTAV